MTDRPTPAEPSRQPDDETTVEAESEAEARARAAEEAANLVAATLRTGRQALRRKE